MGTHSFSYEVTRDGKVFSTNSNWRGCGTRELTQFPNSHGYMRVKMAIDGKRKTFMVHKLVAEKFLPQRPTDYHEIRHIDGDRRNNNASNLSWGTRKENAQDREKHGKTSRGDKHSAAIKASLVNVVNWRKKRRLEREANARLIASAPDMYAVLKQIIDDYKNTDDPLLLQERMDANITDAEAAINKAEGKV